MENRKQLLKTRSQSLSFNFISKTVLILLAIQVGSAFFIHHNQSAKISHDMSVRGQGLADAFASISSEFIISYNMMALDNIVTNLKEQEGVVHAVFYDESQAPLTTSDDNINLIDTKEFKADVVFEEMTLGSFSIWLSTESEKKALNTLIIMLSIATVLVIFLLVIALLYLFKVQVIKPLAKIGRHAEAIATGDLNREIVVDRGDEIGNLLFSFDHMLDNLKLKAEEAENIANGFLDKELSLASDEDVLGKAFIKVQENLKKLVEQMETISDSAQDGYLHIRGDVESFSGKYNEMIEAVNRLADTLVDHIDQVPSPVFLIDQDFNIKFMNQYGAELCGKEKADMVGTKCFNHFNTAHCNTENCACFQAMKKKEEVTSETQAHLSDQTMDIKYTGKPIYDVDGAVNGAIEIITDQTDIIAIQKKTVKISDYQATEITKLSSTLEKMSEGDLSVSYEMEPSDDDTQEVYNSFVLLSKAFNKTLHGLNDILGRVNQTVGQVNQGATQVSSASQSLSQQATEQASSLEEVSSSLQEISSQTQSNAESAEHANRLSISAGEVAETGNSRMKDMLQAMGDINTSSHEIKKIIKVIDEIAFQTNLLALNAAVEAARAGVHGKGFAVVAEEVRNLAKRSATAAKETTQLIEDSVGKAENGGQIAGETAEALEKIEEHVNKVADLIGEINAGSKEQNHALKEITEALTQIDQITQSNTANAEQSASASEELAGQSDELRNMLSNLKLKEDTVKFRRETKKRSMLNGHNGEVLFKKSDITPESFVTPDQIIDLEDTDFSNF